MKTISTALRLSLGLGSLALIILGVLHAIGLVPDDTMAVLQGRKALCEAMAIYGSSTAIRGDEKSFEAATREIVARSKDIRSVTVRTADGRVLTRIGEVTPGDAVDESQVLSNPNLALVPVFADGRRWGTFEVRFQAINPLLDLALLASPAARFVAVFSVLLFAVNFMYIYLIIRKEKSRAAASKIPERVRATLDTLVEGVLLMDVNHRIAMANKSFARTVGRSPDELEGRSAGELNWQPMRPPSVKGQAADAPGNDTPSQVGDLPWQTAVALGSPALGTLVGLTTGSRTRTFSVNSTPIRSDDGRCRGVLATFDDLTRIERMNQQLRRLNSKLKRSQGEIHSQNQRLTDLATRDPLTGCLNRRAFFEKFDQIWAGATSLGAPLSCVILDIDHFKSVNDRYGHSVGDEAIKMVAGVLRSVARSQDVVCRYGGEEFVLLMPETAIADAMTAAERLRLTIAETTFCGITVRSSFGVAALSMGATDPHDLLNKADQALYGAKRSGRDRVMRHDTLPPELLEAPAKLKPRGEPATPSYQDVPIPYHAVASLIAALSHRDAYTASHSRRVADLCATAARGRLAPRESYELEIAALLHDVGKLGVPDAVLNKPGPLTDAERTIMRSHDEIGVAIVNAAFASESVRETIRTHHAWFGGKAETPHLPTGLEISLPARLLAIADAYDAMTTDRVYKPRKSHEEALVELRRCAGQQFDPELVEHFIRTAVPKASDPETAPPPLLTHRAALRIGLLMETLADVLDSGDPVLLLAKTRQLRDTAEEFQAASVTAACLRLESALAAKGNWLDVLEVSLDLLDICRSTQATYLATATTK